MRPASLLLAVLLPLVGCGEFHTYPYYADGGPADGGPPSLCEVMTQPVISTDSPSPGHLNEPFVLAREIVVPLELLHSELTFDWKVTEGRLPEGLHLHDTDGFISGYPQEAGDFPLTLTAIPDSFHPCVERADTQLTLTVKPGCESPADCSARPSAPDLEPVCEEAGYCTYDYPVDNCPSGYGTTVRWGLADTLQGTGTTLCEVLANNRLSAADKAVLPQESYSHRLQLKLVGEETTGNLYYRLPDDWPAPYAAGERVVLQELDGAVRPARALLLTRQDGSTPLLLYDGPLMPGAPGGDCSHALCETNVSQHHLRCAVGDDSHQCGPRTHDLLRLTAETGVESQAVAGQRPVVALGEHTCYFFVGSAYSHAPGGFNHQQCAFVIPTEASFMLFDRDSCPIARVTQQEQSLVLGKAAEAPVIYLDGSPSFGHDGAVIEHFDWELEQPYDGLVTLGEVNRETPAKTPWLRWLSLPAVGNYHVRLRVTDDLGRTSCAAELAQLEVRSSASTDLRIELVWRTLDEELAQDEALDLLIMYPTYAKLLGEQPWSAEAWHTGKMADGTGQWPGSKWVCSASNPAPSNWVNLAQAAAEPQSPSDRLCNASDGLMEAGGHPETITVVELNRDQKSNDYHVAVRAPEDNNQMVYATLRVFIQGKPMYETAARAIAPGQIWHAGHVNVEFMKFQPAKNGL